MANAKKILRDILKNKQDTNPTIIGFMGDLEGNVVVPGRPDYVYVRLNERDVFEVYNTRVIPTLDLQVVIGRDSSRPRKTQVLSTTSLHTYGNDNKSQTSIPAHGETHIWLESDPTLIHLRAFLPFRIGSAGGLAVQMWQGLMWDGTNYKFVESIDSIDLSEYVPGMDTPASSRFVLLCLSSGGALEIVPGAIVLSSIFQLTDIPQPPATANLVLAAIRLYTNQTAIVESKQYTDIVDLRFPLKHLHPEYAPIDSIRFLSQPDSVTSSDTYIEDNTMDANHNSLGYIKVGNTDLVTNRSLIKFDLTSIPASAQIISATLTLRLSETSGTTSCGLAAYRVLKDWVAAQSTWNIYKTGSAWDMGGAFFPDGTDCEMVYTGTATVNGSTPQYDLVKIILDPDHVKEWVDGTLANNGVLLKALSESGKSFTFYSSNESTFTTLRPALEVIYTLGGDLVTNSAWEHKGDILVGTGDSEASLLPVGTTGQIITPDDDEVTGVKWVDPIDILSILQAQEANKVYAGPESGADAAPTFRGLVAADFPLVIALKNADELTIDSGVVTVNSSYHIIKAYSGDADDLDTISGGEDYHVLFIKAYPDDVITLKHGTGNIVLADATDVNLSEDAPSILFFDGANWHLVNGSGGGAGGGNILTDTNWDAKGDMVIGTGASEAVILPIGTPGQIPVADPAAATGIKWIDSAGTSTFGELISDNGTTFTTAAAFVAGSLRVYLNGIRQDPSVFTEAVGHDGFDTTFTVEATDVLTVDYNGTGASVSVDVAAYVRPALKVWMGTNFS